VVPIKCGNIDLDNIIEGIQATRVYFPWKYLGLPLSVWQHKRVEFQNLEDKCAGKLPTWNGKYVTSGSHGPCQICLLIANHQGLTLISDFLNITYHSGSHGPCQIDHYLSSYILLDPACCPLRHLEISQQDRESLPLVG
jgi:hypothetical protein